MSTESLGLLWTAGLDQPADTLPVCLCSVFKAFQNPPLLSLLGQKGCPLQLLAAQMQGMISHPRQWGPSSPRVSMTLSSAL